MIDICKLPLIKGFGKDTIWHTYCIFNVEEVTIKTLIAFGFLLLVGFAGSIKLFKRLKHTSPFSYLFYSGTIYIFFGLLIGENGINLISGEIIHHLEPVIGFSLGLVGFIFGFQMKLKFLKRINGSWYLTLVFTFFIAFLTIFFIGMVLIDFFGRDTFGGTGFTLGMAILLSILLAESSIPYVVWSLKLFKKQTESMRLCLFISSTDNFFPILFTGLFFSLYSFLPVSGQVITNSAWNFLYSFMQQFLAGIAVGYGMYVLQKRLKNKYEIPIILFGSVFLIAGYSVMFSGSILFVAMVSGAVFSNLVRRNSQFLEILSSTEKPIYLVFLIFLALRRSIFSVEMIAIALVLLLIKFSSRTLVFKSLHRFKPRWFDTSPFYSYLLLPISSIAPAILLEFRTAFPLDHTAIVSGIFIMCFIMAELFAPMGIKIVQGKLVND